MILINYFLVSTENLIESINLELDRISSIDDARILVIQNLDYIYKDLFYQLDLINKFDNDDTIINVIFENDILLKREITINKLL